MPSNLTFHSQSEAMTDQFAATCAAAVSDGLTWALNGQLGSGKTRFVKGFCAGLGMDSSQVTSPTFVLLQLYQGNQWRVCHFDTYRLADHDEFLALGAEEFLFDRQCICLVEWAERVAEIIPLDHLQVDISQSGPTDRRFELSSHGAVSDALLERIRRTLDPQQSSQRVGDSKRKHPGGTLPGS